MGLGGQEIILEDSSRRLHLCVFCGRAAADPPLCPGYPSPHSAKKGLHSDDMFAVVKEIDGHQR